jgi:Phosphoribosyl transferase domain
MHCGHSRAKDGVGAIAEDGTVVLDTEVARRVGMTERLLNAAVEREVRELRRRVAAYRDSRPPVDVRGRTVIVVDDGLATGLTDLAAVRALRARGAGRIVVAVPVGARESVARVGQEADEIVCHSIPHDLHGVGVVSRLLPGRRRRRGAAASRRGREGMFTEELRRRLSRASMSRSTSTIPSRRRRGRRRIAEP